MAESKVLKDMNLTIDIFLDSRFDWDTRPWGNLDVISAVSRGNSGWGGCCWQLCGGDYGYQCRFVPNNNQRVYLYMRNVRSIRIVDCSGF